MYEIEIKINRVKDTDDLMLKLIDVIRNIDRKHVPETKKDNDVTLPLIRKGIQHFGSITVKESDVNEEA